MRCCSNHSNNCDARTKLTLARLMVTASRGGSPPWTRFELLRHKSPLSRTDLRLFLRVTYTGNGALYPGSVPRSDTSRTWLCPPHAKCSDTCVNFGFQSHSQSLENRNLGLLWHVPLQLNKDTTLPFVKHPNRIKLTFLHSLDKPVAPPAHVLF